MKKPLLLIFILLISLNLVYAATVLKEGESTKVKGKTITLVSIGDYKVVVNVDGVKDIINLKEEKLVNGALIEVLETDDAVVPPYVELTIDVKDECGNKICDSTENSKICCTDCGCLAGLECTSNICIDPKANECTTNSNCDDKNINTTDLCSGIPRKCSNTEIDFSCIQNTGCDDKNPDTQDTCVNNRCSFILYSELAECQTNQDCDDGNLCTKEKCEGLPLKCVYDSITSCGSHDDCCPPGCFYPDDLNCPKEKGQQLFDEQNETVDEEVNTTETTEVQTEKVSFFAKIVNFFKNLFS
ncbi:MAG: hypothetical protein HYS32_02610 [Candidatus Woesearchaeota archaeon]|nr:MAG: hypothetical protein HYS32_02610 [Candidatus Woesearchaeota archaeon]